MYKEKVSMSVTIETRRQVNQALRHSGDHRALAGLPRTGDGLESLFASPTQPHTLRSFYSPDYIREHTAHVVDAPTTKLELTDGTSITINDEAYKTATRPPEMTVTLDMFSPTSNLCETPIGQRYLDAESVTWLSKVGNSEKFSRAEASRKVQRLKTQTHVTSDEYDAQRATEIELATANAKRRINTKVYSTIMDDFGFTSIDEAQAFYERQARHANAAIMKHGQLLYSEGKVDDIQLPVDPGELVALYVNKETSPELRHKIRAEFLLEYIAGEIELHDENGADRKLEQIEVLLDDKFFDNEKGKGKTIQYGIFNNETNKLERIFTGELDVKPEGHHIKTIIGTTRTVKDTHEEVTVKYSKKNTDRAAVKAIRKAQKYAAERGHSQIRPDYDVNDTHRMMLVVNGDQKSVDNVVDRIFDLLVENPGYFPEGAPYAIEPADDSKAHEPGKSKDYRRRRIKMYFEGMVNPVEIIVQTLQDHINSDNALDEAHSLLAMRREQGLRHLLVPYAEEPDDTNIRTETNRLRKTRVINLADSGFN